MNKPDEHVNANLSYHYVKLDAEVKFEMPMTGSSAGAAGKKGQMTFAEDAFSIPRKLTNETLRFVLSTDYS